MASPAPQGDQSDLPAPWIRQFDANYQTFFYVNPTTNPPTTSWTHPSLSEGEIHPEQAQALQEFSQSGGQDDGGEAAKFLNSGSVADPIPRNSGQGQIQGADGQSPQTGDRGLGSMVSGLMGKQNNNQYGYNQQQQYGQQQYGGYNQGYPQQYPQQQQQQSSGSKFGFGSGVAAGGAALIAGKLISSAIGGNRHNSHGGHSMGAPPFMGGGGGGMGGLGSLLGGGGGGGMGGMGGMFGGGGPGGGFGGGGHHGGGHGGGGFGGGGFGGGGGGGRW
ncbi:hypothetical protein IAR50_003410 [Cryptococcus sp. DSM 104548]